MHGAHEAGSGPQIQTVGYFFGWFIFAILAAYYAMKLTAARREDRERVAKRMKGR